MSYNHFGMGLSCLPCPPNQLFPSKYCLGRGKYSLGNNTGQDVGRKKNGPNGVAVFPLLLPGERGFREHSKRGQDIPSVMTSRKNDIIMLGIQPLGGAHLQKPFKELQISLALLACQALDEEVQCELFGACSLR